jgi:hypothetical protein
MARKKQILFGTYHLTLQAMEALVELNVDINMELNTAHTRN